MMNIGPILLICFPVLPRISIGLFFKQFIPRLICLEESIFLAREN
jgi:hypothetical protein